MSNATDDRDPVDHSLNDLSPDDLAAPELVAGVHTIGALPAWHQYLTVRSNGTLLFDEAIIGRCESDPDGAPRVVLNLGWLKAVGVGVTLQNDPDVDKGRSGFVIQRPEPGEAPEPF